jgi:hypothetical protein
MEFKSRFTRGLPVLALVASLLVPFKPVAAAAGPYTANPEVATAPAAQINAGCPTCVTNELDAAGKLRQPGRGKTKTLLAVSDGVDAAAGIRKPIKRRHLLTTVADEVDAAAGMRRPIKRRKLLTTVASEIDAAGKLRQPGRGKTKTLIAVSDELDATTRIKKGRKPLLTTVADTKPRLRHKPRQL